jgi:hypothetical protein
LHSINTVCSISRSLTNKKEPPFACRFSSYPTSHGIYHGNFSCSDTYHRIYQNAQLGRFFFQSIRDRIYRDVSLVDSLSALPKKRCVSFKHEKQKNLPARARIYETTLPRVSSIFLKDIYINIDTRYSRLRSPKWETFALCRAHRSPFSRFQVSQTKDFCFTWCFQVSRFYV